MSELSSTLAHTAAADPLSLTVHSTPDPAAQQRTRTGRLKMLLVLLVCAAPVVASYLTYYVIRPQGRTNYGTLIDPQRPLPRALDLPLQDLRGQAVDPASLRRQWLLVVVSGGDCDARCEQLLYTQRQLREMLGKDKDRLDRVWLLDDAQAVREAVLPGMAGATLLRAPREAVARWLAPEPGQALEAHLYLVDPLGNWMMRFPAAGEPGKIKRDLERLMRASASWDEAGR